MLKLLIFEWIYGVEGDRYIEEEVNKFFNCVPLSLCDQFSTIWLVVMHSRSVSYVSSFFFFFDLDGAGEKVSV